MLLKFLLQDYDVISLSVEELSNQNSLDTTLAILQAAAAQSEEDSEVAA